MALENRLQALQERHLKLEQKLEQELNHSARDGTRLRSLKRKKLMLKDEIERLHASAA